MTTIGDIGVGLFILCIIWIITLIIFVLSVKFNSNFGWTSLGVTSIITTVLIIIPTEESQNENVEFSLEKDYNFLYRLTLLIFLIIGCIVGCVGVFLLHCIVPIKERKNLQDVI